MWPVVEYSVSSKKQSGFFISPGPRDWLEILAQEHGFFSHFWRGFPCLHWRGYNTKTTRLYEWKLCMTCNFKICQDTSWKELILLQVYVLVKRHSMYDWMKRGTKLWWVFEEWEWKKCTRFRPPAATMTLRAKTTVTFSTFFKKSCVFWGFFSLLTANCFVQTSLLSIQKA